MLSLATSKGWHLAQLDINNAFLNGDLIEDIYMELPQGFKVQGEHIVCKLQKPLYGLRQASRQWFSKFLSAMLQLGFLQSKSDYSLFTKGKDQSFVALLVYVDDMIIAGPSTAVITAVKQQLQNHFKLKDLGVLHYFLGLEIARSKPGIFICQ